MLGASEGDPDSAWRIYNDDFAEPVATASELDQAQMERDQQKRHLAYQEFERRSLFNGLYIPLKNELTYIVTSKRVFLDRHLSTDWGVKLTKLKRK
ncbi:MAG: hypothetical protein HC902_07670 [Calothrix sp. SM1_5_4]|nr:hypothetical protein [Calothrix sp. SM1_5_4]